MDIKYPQKGTKKYDVLVLKKAKELRRALEADIIRQCILAKKSYDKWVK